MYQCQWISSISTRLPRLHAVSFLLFPLIHYLSTLKGKLLSLKVHKIFGPSQMLPVLKKHSVLQYESNTLKHILPQVCIHTYIMQSHVDKLLVHWICDLGIVHQIQSDQSMYAIFLMQARLLLDSIIFYATLVVWLLLVFIEVVLQTLRLLVRK